jgi:succinate-semialdehyde dehydrogenase/glutarate-semialdehyde dehydrogenase
VTDYAVIDPATGETIETYETISDAALRDAIARADETHRVWAASTTAEDRGVLLARAAELHAERREELAGLISQEMGKSIEGALGEIDYCVDAYRYFAERGPAMLADQPLEVLAGNGSAVLRRTSSGTLLGIMPWNYPVYQVMRFAGPNLMVGNPILLKHAPQCPASAAAMEAIFRDAGFPDGMYTNIYATHEQVEWVLADPRVHGVSLTGSERAGAAVAAIAGRNLKKAVLELGGSDPFIVLRTADLDAVVEGAVGARLENAGQMCNAAKRFIVVDDLYEAFVEKFAAALTAAAGSVDPLSSSAAADRLQAQVERAVDQGAEVVAGGGREGNRFEPTLLAGVTPESDTAQEELFGPVALVFRASDEDEAVRLANDTAYGLGSYVFTDDPEQAERVAERIEAGMVNINGVGLDGFELPFGGIKRSGFGREGGAFGLDEFVNKKLIRTAG